MPPDSSPGNHADIEFGRLLAAARKEQGLSQSALARRAHMSKDSLGRLERGERRVAGRTERDLLVAALGIDATTLPLPAPAADGRVELHARTTARVWDSFPAHDVNRSIASAVRRIWIWITWLQGDQLFLDALRRGVANNAELRILATDPDCPEAVDRASGLGYVDGRAQLRRMHENLMADLCTIGHPDVTTTVRLGGTMPVAQLYVADDRLLAGWFFPGRASTLTPQVDVDTTSSLGRALLESFASQWEQATPYRP